MDMHVHNSPLSILMCVAAVTAVWGTLHLWTLTAEDSASARAIMALGI